MGHYQYRKPKGILTENTFSDEWLKDFLNCSGLENEMVQRAAKEILSNIVGKVVVARKKIDDKIVGCGYGAIERGYIGIFDVIVDEHYRGKGFGQDIMDGILSTATDEKIENAYLSVVVGNTPAENLYQKLGFKEIYRYWYRKKSIHRAAPKHIKTGE
jgi:ribosomal protein S18 acetylase RimI-like enzyme